MFLHRYTLLNTKTVFPDHENVGTDILFVVLLYTVKQILLKIEFSVMVSLQNCGPFRLDEPSGLLLIL